MERRFHAGDPSMPPEDTVTWRSEMFRKLWAPLLLIALTGLGGPGSGSAQSRPVAGQGDDGARPPGAFLGDLTWPDAETRLASAPLVILPFGAGAKEHGPHLPMNADAVVMEVLCQAAVDSLPALVAPPILHGWFPAFRGFPGTEVADPAVLQSYVMEIAKSLVQAGAQR